MVFQKPFRELKTSAPLRNSDRRKLKSRIIAQYNLLDDARVDALVPDGIQLAKFVASGGEHGVLYSSPVTDGSTPLWFNLGREGDRDAELVIPTLYTLWRSPGAYLIPAIRTPDGVLPILMGGADLMIPGVHTPREVLDPLSTGAIVSVRNVAIGRMALPGKDIQPRRKGKAVLILHVMGDQVFEMGPRSQPTVEEGPEDGDEPDLQAVNGGLANSAQQADAVPQTAEALEKLHLAEGNSSSAQPIEATALTEDAKPTLTAQEVDGLLRTGLLLAILSCPHTALPISTSNFYSSHILPSRPAHPTLSSSTPVDIKHSSFKSLSAFLKSAEKDGLLTIKAKGDSITMLNADQYEVSALASNKIRTVADAEAKAKRKEADEKAKGETSKTIEVVELWKPSGVTAELFKDAGADKSALYTAAELRNTFAAYVSAKQLQNAHEPQYINVPADSILYIALEDKRDRIGEHCRRDEAVKRLQKNMQQWHSINGIVKKGGLSHVNVVSKMRQGKRPVTLITNFEAYGLEPQSLADELRPLCAGSTSINPLPGKNAGTEVMIQGKQIKNVVEVLLGRGIPKKWIETDDLTDKK
ncbi:hypothetical protein BKA62DRAFT_696192 [Auriculariales sp. MPI-PUGE-AT-0066]|nr:hypothetical protein BKA62DRAFT_696192 [Auriculariales sp. MPI-PUGE-AT-0066]